MSRRTCMLALACLLLSAPLLTTCADAVSSTPSASDVASPTSRAAAVSAIPTSVPMRTAAPLARDATVVALVNGTLIDGTGKDPLPDAVLVIRSGRVTAVGQRSQIELPEGAEVIDVQGATILPGFINAHVHRTDEQRARAWLAGGVTTVRDLGLLFDASGSPERAADLYAQAADTAGQADRARVVAASPLVGPPRGYGQMEVASVEEAPDKVGLLSDLGAQVIKIAVEDNLPLGHKYPLLSVDVAQAIVEAAHTRGMPVSAHVSRVEHVELALAAGVDDLAHMVYDVPLPDDLAARLAKAGVYWVPTMELWDGVGWGAPTGENLRRFVAAGGQVALGTDYAGYTIEFDLGMPITEVELMRQYGMSPMQIIVAATKNAAHVCGLDGELGTLEPGKVADVLVVDGNPLVDLRALLNVRLVMRNGTVAIQK